MRAYFIGFAQTFWLITQFIFKAGEPTFPMSTIRFAFAPFLGHQIKGKLVRIEFFGSLSDARTLSLEQIGQ